MSVSALVGEWLNFDDLHISPLSITVADGEFSVSTTRPTRISKFARMPVRGRYRFDRGIVSAGIFPFSYRLVLRTSIWTDVKSHRRDSDGSNNFCAAREDRAAAHLSFTAARSRTA